jgi:hypothetical protein
VKGAYDGGRPPKPPGPAGDDGGRPPKPPGPAGVLLALALAGCNQDPGADNGKGIDEPAPCPECVSGAAYPATTGVVAQGTIIPDFSFQGFVDAEVQGKTLQTIALASFYNPHAGDPSYQPSDPSEDDRLFPPGSPYGAGTKKPTALLVDVASVWCGPCNQEAKSVLNGLYAKYKPCGGEFLFQLAEGAAPGAPVTSSLLQAWTSTYHVAYPATFDPGRQLFPLYNSDSFPDSAIVDTHTMQIVDVISGVPDATFWSTFETHLDQACLAGG